MRVCRGWRETINQALSWKKFAHYEPANVLGTDTNVISAAAVSCIK